MKTISEFAVRLSGAALLAAGLLTAPVAARGQAVRQVAELEPPPATDQAFELSIRSIMRGHELIGKEPRQVTWTDDSEWIYFRWLPGGRAWHEDRKLYRVPADGGEPELVADEVPDSLAPLLSGGDLSDDRSRRVTAVRGDLYVVDRATQSVRRLTDTGAREGSPSFGATGDRVFYTQDLNLFSLDLDGGGITQLTDLRQGPRPRRKRRRRGVRRFSRPSRRSCSSTSGYRRTGRRSEKPASRGARKASRRPSGSASGSRSGGWPRTRPAPTWS